MVLHRFRFFIICELEIWKSTKCLIYIFWILIFWVNLLQQKPKLNIKFFWWNTMLIVILKFNVRLYIAFVQNTRLFTLSMIPLIWDTLLIMDYCFHILTGAARSWLSSLDRVYLTNRSWWIIFPSAILFPQMKCC